MIYGQKDEDLSIPTKIVPKAAFSPFKGIHDQMDLERKKQEERKKLEKMWAEQNNDDDDNAFEIEDNGD